MKRIPLTQGQFALVDDEDFERLNSHKWFAAKKKHTFYAARQDYSQGKQITIRMHREVMSAPPGIEVDHRNGNGLDNQRGNLRFASDSQNLQNTRKREGTSSQFKGVGWHKSEKRWRARIGTNRQNIFLGYFDSEKDAALAYDKKARELFDDFASPNFPI